MMTVEQVLIETQKLLLEINVPVGLIEQIGLPIDAAARNIQQCIDAFNMQKNESKELQDHAEEENTIISEETVGGESEENT